MPRPSTAMTWSQSSTVDSRMSPRGMIPAFATSTSSRPKRSTAVWIIRWASSTSETSPVTASTSAPVSRSSAGQGEQRIFLDIGDDEAGAFLGKAHRRGAADTKGGAGDDADGVLESGHATTPSGPRRQMPAHCGGYASCRHVGYVARVRAESTDDGQRERPGCRFGDPPRMPGRGRCSQRARAALEGLLGI